MAVDIGKIKDALAYRQFYARYIDPKTIKGPGPEHTSKCPFPSHADSHGSFCWNELTGLWKCQTPTCEGTDGGDVITFVEKIERLTQIKAIEFLGNYTGVSDKYDANSGKEVLDEAKLGGIRDDAHEYLMLVEPHTTQLREEIMSWRGWEKETLIHWKIGYDPRFKRFTIPVHDADGICVNIRMYHPEKQPKVINTTGHGKGRIFNVEAINGPGSKVIICEGETDVITAWQFGFDCVSGTTGAGSWKSEWNVIFDGCDVFIVYDCDHSGREGAKTVAGDLYAGANEISIIALGLDEDRFPKGDLSDLLQEEGAVGFTELLVRAQEYAPIGTQDPAWGMANTPDGYAMTREAVSKEARTRQGDVYMKRVNSGMIWPSRYGSGVGNQASYLELTWSSEVGVESKFFPRGATLDKARLKALADWRVPVTSENAGDLVTYIDAFQHHASADIPKVDVTARNGWFGPDFAVSPGWDDKRFVLGENTFGSDVPVIQEDSITARATYGAHGSFDAWLTLMERAYQESQVGRLYLYAGMAAPLMRVLELRSFIFFNYAHSRSGKTAWLKLVGSLYGDPNRMMASMNQTLHSIEKRLEYHSDTPYLVDELQLQQNAKFLEKLIYMIPAEVGKGRGTRDGGLQDVSRWKTIAMITGEQPIIAMTDLGGQTTRVLEIPGPPIKDEAFASEIHRTVRKNYGHVAPLVIPRLLTCDYGKLYEQYEEAQKLVQGAMANRLVGSMMDSVAVMLLGGFLYHDWVRQAPLSLESVLESMIEPFTAVSKFEAYWRRSYGMAQQRVLRYQRSFQQPWRQSLADRLDPDENNRNKGWSVPKYGDFYGRIPALDENDEIGSEVWVLKSVLEEWLVSAGFNYRVAINTWKEIGIIADGRGPVTYEGKSRHLIRLKWLTSEQLDALE